MHGKDEEFLKRVHQKPSSVDGQMEVEGAARTAACRGRCCGPASDRSCLCRPLRPGVRTSSFVRDPLTLNTSLKDLLAPPQEEPLVSPAPKPRGLKLVDSWVHEDRGCGDTGGSWWGREVAWDPQPSRGPSQGLQHRKSVSGCGGPCQC